MSAPVLAAAELLGRLVAHDTTSAGSNRALIEEVAGYLAGHGVDATLVPSADGAKAGLIASIGPAVPGGVVLSGHTDVVPVSGQSWSSDPFQLTLRAGRLHGRGTADMKGFIAAVLALVPDLGRRRLRVPIHIALSYDEEIGCLGAAPLLEALLDAVPRPGLAIVGEPSDMKVANAHRGIAAFETTVIGRPGHSSAPGLGVNAIALAAECIAFLGRRAKAAARARTPEPTTLNVGRIEGGAAVNIIAATCRFEWDCRPAPGRDAAAVLAAFEGFAAGLVDMARPVAPEAAIVTRQLCDVPPLTPEPGSPAEALALALTGRNDCVSVPFASEAGLFRRAGIPAVIVGPGDVAQAHQPDEYVTIDQLEACTMFLSRLADWASEP